MHAEFSEEDLLAVELQLQISLDSNPACLAYYTQFKSMPFTASDYY